MARRALLLALFCAGAGLLRDGLLNLTCVLVILLIRCCGARIQAAAVRGMSDLWRIGRRGTLCLRTDAAL